VALDAGVLALALHPFRELPIAPGIERFEQDGVVIAFNPFPNAQVVEPVDLAPADVPAAVATAREAARERGKRLLAWWITPEHSDLEDALEREGLVHEDTPGFEAVETAMVLVTTPVGDSSPEIAVNAVESYEEFLAAMSVVMDAFEMPDEMRAEAIADFPQRWEEYGRPGNPTRQYLARIGDDVVGTASAVFGEAGINLFGGAVLPRARGRGVYRELTISRWDEAVRRGSPALTVQAGRMSMPVLAKLGFERVGEAHLFVDDLGGSGE
jgi:GNAT superfamily N-acetyltransferase